ncbi:hypothetical protein J4429_02820 [Candidatus Pacearchaeota archaeon]|nr:hypothetical protein [Candidatus Pacearchaeota archaeon]
MINVEQRTVERKEIPLRIWGSLKGLEPRVDFVIDREDNRELILAIEEGSLETITRINGTNDINYNERILINYELHQMKPKKVTRYSERSYDAKLKAIYDCYNQMLAGAET